MIPPAATPRRAWPVPLTVVTILVWLPGLILAGGMAVASVLGCSVHEGFPQPCMLWGRDIGGLLYSSFVMGWLMIVLLPFMAASLVIWTVLGLRWLWRRFR